MKSLLYLTLSFDLATNILNDQEISHFITFLQIVMMGDLQTNGQIVDRVIVSNLRKLQLGEICINLSLQNVGSVMVTKHKGHTKPACKTDFTLSAKNSNLDRLPSGASRINLKDSTITSLATDTNIKELSISNSAVKVLDIAKPFEEGSTATFISSNIDTLQKLEMGHASRLTIQHTTIDVLASEGLILRGGSTEIKSSFAVTVLDDSVLLGADATLHIENYSEQLRISVLKYDVQKPSAADYFYFWAFIVSVVLLVVFFFILVGMKCYKGKNKYTFVSQKHIHQTIETS